MIESPDFDEHFRDADASVRQIAQRLRDDGFVTLDFPEPDFDRIADRLVAALDRHFPNDRRVMNVWRDDWDDASTMVRRLASNKVILELLAHLFGRTAFPFQTLNFRSGSEQRAHSDSAHFSSFPERFMCGVWIALEDVTEDAGPLFYHPQSHRLPILSHDQLGLETPVTPDQYPRLEDAWEAIVASEGLRREIFLPRRGQAGIWLANLLHGGMPVRSRECTRYSMVTHYYFENCTHYTPLHSNPAKGEIALRAPSAIRED